MIVGDWKLSKEGFYYRRRKSRYNNWYTEKLSAIDYQYTLEEVNGIETESDTQWSRYIIGITLCVLIYWFFTRS